MTDEERDAALERVADRVILSLETIADNLAKIVSGEVRVAMAEREVGVDRVTEFRLVPAPAVVPAPSAEFDEVKRLLMQVKRTKGFEPAQEIIQRHGGRGKKLADLKWRPETWDAVVKDCQALLPDWRLSEDELDGLATPK